MVVLVMLSVVVVVVVVAAALLWCLSRPSDKKQPPAGSFALCDLSRVVFSLARRASAEDLPTNVWQESSERRQAVLSKRMQEAVEAKRAAFLARQKEHKQQ
jgi:hypothetical protein